MSLISTETRRRLRRTLLQVVAGGAVTSVLVAWLSNDWASLKGSVATAVGAMVAAFSQNTLEDAGKTKDRRSQ